VNGDIFTDINFSGLKLSHHTSLQALAHLVLVNNPSQHPNGDFAIEEGMLTNEGSQKLTFSGVGVYHPDLFASVMPGSPAKLAPLLRQAISQKQATAEHYQGVWHDIGTPERLESLEKQLQQQTL
jgi:MurNAc alpha-1-phosphate uridylyltransferase